MHSSIIIIYYYYFTRLHNPSTISHSLSLLMASHCTCTGRSRITATPCFISSPQRRPLHLVLAAAFIAGPLDSLAHSAIQPQSFLELCRSVLVVFVFRRRPPNSVQVRFSRSAKFPSPHSYPHHHYRVRLRHSAESASLFLRAHKKLIEMK